MPRNFPKFGYRPKSDPPAPFHVVLDQLHNQQGAPNGAVSHSRVVPAGDWTYPAADAAPVSSVVAAAEMYIDAEVVGTTPQITPRSIEEPSPKNYSYRTI